MPPPALIKRRSTVDSSGIFHPQKVRNLHETFFYSSWIYKTRRICLPRSIFLKKYFSKETCPLGILIRLKKYFIQCRKVPSRFFGDTCLLNTQTVFNLHDIMQIMENIKQLVVDGLIVTKNQGIILNFGANPSTVVECGSNVIWIKICLSRKIMWYMHLSWIRVWCDIKLALIFFSSKHTDWQRGYYWFRYWFGAEQTKTTV